MKYSYISFSDDKQFFFNLGRINGIQNLAYWKISPGFLWQSTWPIIFTKMDRKFYLCLRFVTEIGIGN